jgi:hypothetical protein
MIGESAGFRGAPPPPITPSRRTTRQPQPPRAIAKVTAFLTRGTPATRLLAAGILLAVGLPVLTILVYVWGYPSSPIPPAVVVSVGGLQVLIVLNAIVVVFQLVGGKRIRVSRVSSRHRRVAAAREIPLPIERSEPAGLRQLSLSLAEMLWEHEQRGQFALGPAILDYVHDAVTAELVHRRRRSILERRLAELEVSLRGGAGTEAPEGDAR